ncbi:MAG: hypothetical protein AAF585_18355, partial [Verrucomicrobiota bacterium]
CWQASGEIAKDFVAPGAVGGGAGNNNPPAPNPGGNGGGGGAGPKPPAGNNGFQWSSNLHRSYYEGDLYDQGDRLIGWAWIRIRGSRSYTAKVKFNNGIRDYARGKVSTSGSATSPIRLSRIGRGNLQIQMIDDVANDITLIEGTINARNRTFYLDLEQD